MDVILMNVNGFILNKANCHVMGITNNTISRKKDLKKSHTHFLLRANH